MLGLKQTYLVPFDPHDTGEPFGFMRANISGREQWWLVQVWAEDSPDETVMVRFLEQTGPDGELIDLAETYAGRPWYPIAWISDEVPNRFAPSFRLALDMPGGARITHEWGPDPIGEDGRKTVQAMIDKACAGFVHG
jgi:hypothetical protein